MEIDARSVDTGVKQLDGILTGETFFDTGEVQNCHFLRPRGALRRGRCQEFEGDLTVKGVTRPVRLTAERFVCQQVSILMIKHYVCGGDLTATVKRSDFGLSKYLTMVSDDVRLTISVEAIREGQ